MIEWDKFFIVLLVSVVAGCGLVLLFSVGLRLVAAERGWRKPLGIASFVACGALIVYGIGLIVPGFW
ncbi:MAG: hypothetical protein ABI400_11735 [Lacisediminihabitans sp.]